MAHKSRPQQQIVHLLTWDVISPLGMGYKDLGIKFQGTLQHLRSAPLKPHQKLHHPPTFIIHFLYATTLAVLHITTIRRMDSLIRTQIKDFLQLHASNRNGILYCSKRDGGLAIPKLEILSVTTVLKQGITLLNTLDQTTEAFLHSTPYEQRLERLANSARIQWPNINFRQIEAYKENQKKEELRQWGALPYKGKKEFLLSPTTGMAIHGCITPRCLNRADF